MSTPPTIARTFDRDYAAFLGAYPAYTETSILDELRATEFQRLDDQRLVYLDYTWDRLDLRRCAGLHRVRSRVHG